MQANKQQEGRAEQARGLSEAIARDIESRRLDAQVTYKGEAFDVLRGDEKVTITANADGSFTIDAVSQGIGSGNEKQSAQQIRDAMTTWLTGARH
ncbi:MAG: hypothetical protein JWQ17_6271 [Tardiphaga sp.]|nr:hypothetical protein [Tardiphaga sp.]